MCPIAFDQASGVSALVAHYGDPERTARVVDDLLAQVADRPIEVVVADDCAPVPFASAAPGVRVVRRTRNGGYGAALNSAASLATHPLLLLLNNDLRLTTTFVEELCREAERHQPCVAGPCTVEDGKFIVTGRRFPTPTGQALEWFAPLASTRRKAWHQRAAGRDLSCRAGVVVTPVDWLQGSALLVPAADFHAVGGFDERFFMFSEEVDLQRRLTGRGLAGAFIGTVEVRHEGSASTNPERAVEWMQRSRLTYARKWGGERRLRALFRLVAILNLVWNVAAKASGSPAAPRHAWRRQRLLAELPVWPPVANRDG